jgi:hypothetical protein
MNDVFYSMESGGSYCREYQIDNMGEPNVFLTPLQVSLVMFRKYIQDINVSVFKAVTIELCT